MNDMSTYINGKYTTSTNPQISYNLSYITKRSGNKLLYRFCIEILPVTDSLYFAYNLKADISINGSKLLTGGVIKNTSPSQWSNKIVKYFPHQTAYYEVDYVDGKTELPCTFKVYSSQTKGSASSEGRMIIVPEAENNLSGVKVKVGGQWKTAENVYIKVGGVWKTAERVYIKVGGIWKEV